MFDVVIEFPRMKVGVATRDDRVVEIRYLHPSSSVIAPRNQLAERAAELAVRLALNEPVATDKSVHNGKGNVPAILLDPVMVDRTSIDATVVKDGFHKREEIYAGAE